MKKSKKMFLRVLPVLMVMLVLIVSPVFGITPVDPDDVTTGKPNTNITNVAGNIWQTVSVIVQVVAVAAVVFAGLRYMFASANDKADIKKQTVILIVGAVLVFAAVPLMQLVANVATDIIK